MSYLTEHTLNGHLARIYPNEEFVHNKQVPGSNVSFRPDYRSDNLKLIIEFDGWQHYCSAKTQVHDRLKTSIYESMGYRIIRIPYFIQITKETVQILFSSNISVEQTYKHGFIDSKCKLPGDFNHAGICRLRTDLERFGAKIQNQIMNSLEFKATDLHNRYSETDAAHIVYGELV